MLGGSIYQTYAIKAAVKMGYYVITCDYLPDNPGHKYAKIRVPYKKGKFGSPEIIEKYD